MNQRFIALPTAALLLTGIPGVALADDGDGRGKEDVTCESVIHIGDSNSVALEQAGLKKAYEDAGVKDVVINASISRTLHETVGNGSSETNEDNGVDGLTRELDGADDDVCVVMALGVNDSGNIGPGASVGAKERIDAVMEVADDDVDVLWPEVMVGQDADERFRSGAELFNEELAAQANEHDNLTVFGVDGGMPESMFRDGIHLTPEGYDFLTETLVNQVVAGGTDDDDDDGGEVRAAGGTVIHIGDSNTVAAEKSDIMSAAYEEAGFDATINASGGRSLREYLNGGSPDTDEDNGVDGLIRELEGADDDATVVMAMGVNDAANIVAGATTTAKERIGAVMEAAGDDRLVVWPTVAVGPGAADNYTEEGAENFNNALNAAADNHDNLLVVDWASKVEDSWFTDGIHYNEDGYRAFVDMIINALSGEGRDGDGDDDDGGESERSGGNRNSSGTAGSPFNDILGGNAAGDDDDDLDNDGPEDDGDLNGDDDGDDDD